MAPPNLLIYCLLMVRLQNSEVSVLLLVVDILTRVNVD